MVNPRNRAATHSVVAAVVSLAFGLLLTPAIRAESGDVSSPATSTADSAAAADAASTPTSNDSLATVVVTARRLNAARSEIETQTGASTYTITSDAIAATPGGENVQLNQVLLQAPDVVQDSFGQLHVRADHNDLQYRLNGVILPEGISVFSQTLSPRLISSLSLITGALPAEYGLRTAGVIDLTTNSGLLQPGGEVSVYGGSHRTIQPSAEYGGSDGQFQLLHDRRLQAEQPRHRITRRQLGSPARSHHSGTRIWLFRADSRPAKSRLADRRSLQRSFRDSESARSATRAGISGSGAERRFSATI